MLMSKTYSDAILSLKAHVQRMAAEMREMAKRLADNDSRIEDVADRNGVVAEQHVVEQRMRENGVAKVVALEAEMMFLREKVGRKDDKIKGLRERIEAMEKKQSKLSEKVVEESTKHVYERGVIKDVLSAYSNIQARTLAIENGLGGLLPLKTAVKQLESKVSALSKDQDITMLRIEDVHTRVQKMPSQSQSKKGLSFLLNSGPILGLLNENMHSRNKSMTSGRKKTVPDILSHIMTQESRKLDDKKKRISCVRRKCKSIKSKILLSFDKDHLKQEDIKLKYDIKSSESAMSVPHICVRIFPAHATKSLEYSLKTASWIKNNDLTPQLSMDNDVLKQPNPAVKAENCSVQTQEKSQLLSSHNSLSVTFLVDDDCYLVDKQGNYVMDDCGLKIVITDDMITD